ncbi:MAG: HAMP domain-containing histidine kinase [Gammaproteobacteria bacterium]|nr:HAMP domain-containing histidine kinase [Gammaproteobacteria bacterium]
MHRFYSLINELKHDQHGQHIRLLLIASYSIIFCIMLAAIAITYKSGSDVITLGTQTHKNSHPVTLQIIALKLSINESNQLINTWLAKPNKEMLNAYKKSKQRLNNELKKLISLTKDNKQLISTLTAEIQNNQKQIKDTLLITNSLDHWKNAREIIKNSSSINNLIDELIKQHTLVSQNNSQKLNNKLSQIINVNIGIMLFALLFGLVIVFKISKHVVNLLDELNKNRADADTARTTAEQKSQELDNTSRVLIKTNRNLIDSIEKLNSTRDQLVQNEKMASLGELVAGVAHEINTPVGIGVTAASHLQDTISIFTKKFEIGKITKTEFARFLHNANEGSEILLNNLHRAAKLIRSFKQIAVDQTSEDRRNFNIKETIEETLLSLQPRIRKTRVKIKLECPEDIEIDSFPGSYSQIISNLITNSLIHGYKENDKGLININVTTSTKSILIKYCDDGCGIPEENLSRAFDPFFTTRRGLGGSGLGLHLVYNIITQQLKGEILITKNREKGLCFEINLPLNLL